MNANEYLEKCKKLEEKEEQKEHFVNRLIKHIRRVQDNMLLLEFNRNGLPFDIEEWELTRRGMQHDLSKFNEELVEGFIKCDIFHRANKSKTKTDITWKDIFPYIEKHRKIEEHHAHNKTEMSNLDLCEMCCDLYAMTQEFKEDDHLAYFKNKLCKDVPMIKKYSKECIEILELLYTLDNIGN